MPLEKGATQRLAEGPVYDGLNEKTKGKQSPTHNSYLPTGNVDSLLVCLKVGNEIEGWNL